MRRAATLACAAVLLAGSVGLARQTPVFRATVAEVVVDVSVRQAEQPVANLTAPDFALTDNGVPQTIDVVTTERLPIDFTFLLDVSGSVAGAQLQRLKQALRDTAAALPATDRVRVVALQQTVREVWPWQPGGAPPVLDGLTAGGATAIYDGLVAVLVRPAEPERRQLIVVLTDGEDTLSVLDLGTARAVALRADAVVQLLLTRNDTPANEGVRELAAATGGQTFSVAGWTAVADAFQRAIDAFRAGYVLHYTPRGVARPGWHDVHVSLTHAGEYEVRARKGYDGGT